MKKFGLGLMALFMVVGVMSGNESNKTEKVTTMESEKTEVQQPQKEKKTVIARVFVKEGQESAFAKAATTLVHATRTEEGNISYTLYQSVIDPKEFIFYEEYKDEAAFAAHASSAHFATFANAIGDMLAKDLIVEEY